MNRWKASGLHLALSTAVVGGIALAALLVWFPHGLYRVANLDRLLLIMLAIDLAMGPLLTLIVYKPTKPSLKFDLAVIGLCQLAFMGYGLHALWQARPVFLVASDVRLNLVFANEIDPLELAEAPRPEWRRLSWCGPQLVGVQAPKDLQSRQQLLQEFLATGRDVETMPRYYVEYSRIAPLLIQRIGGTGSSDPAQRSNMRTVPLLSKYGEAEMLVDPVDATPVKVVVK